MLTTKFTGQRIQKLAHEQYAQTLLCSCDADFDYMSLIYEIYLDIPKLHLHTKNTFSR